MVLVESKLISVIVPVYNVECFLTRCVDSLLKQTYKNIEIILVDDGSLDESGILCDKLALEDERIKVIHKKNGGLSSARNAGLEIASGEFLSFIDSDDFIEHNMLEKMYEDIMQEKADLAIIGRFDDFEDGKTSSVRFLSKKRISYAKTEAMIRLLTHNGIDVSVCDKLFKKELFENISFPEGENNEDCAIIFDVFDKIEKVVHTEGIGYHYCHRRESISASVDLKSLKEIIAHAYAVLNFIREKLPELEDTAIYFVANSYRIVCIYLTGIWIENGAKTDNEIALYKESRGFLVQNYRKYKKYIGNTKEKFKFLLIIVNIYYAVIKFVQRIKRILNLF